MFRNLTCLTFLLGVLAASGCSTSSQGDIVIEPIADTESVTADSLAKFERDHSVVLPQDYRKFLLSHNGGFPSRDCVEFNDGKRKTSTDVFYFFALDDTRDSVSMAWHLSTFAGRIPKETLPIARDSHGNLWLLSLAGDHAGSVFFWDHGTFNTFDETDLKQWPLVANTFGEFMETLTNYDPEIEDGVVLSRYAITKQAVSSMQQGGEPLDVRENLDYVWHCDCDDDGNVKMQFVVYGVHAAVAHTDGYSRVSAMQGLIEAGRTRLPE